MRLRLSEAIKLGAMDGPQCFDVYEQLDGATCAIGAALKAIGDKSEDYCAVVFWPWLDSVCVRCPECSAYQTSPEVVMAHLNDTHRWTREEIADWVATIEPVEQAAAISLEVASADLVAG